MLALRVGADHGVVWPVTHVWFFLTRQADRSVSCARDLLICFAAEVHQRRNASTQGWSACVEGYRERLQRKQTPQHAASRTSSKFGSQAELAYRDTLASRPKSLRSAGLAQPDGCAVSGLRVQLASTRRQPRRKKKAAAATCISLALAGPKKRCHTRPQNARNKERKDAGRRLHRLRLADGPGEPVLQDPRLPRVPRSGRRRVRVVVRLSSVSGQK